MNEVYERLIRDKQETVAKKAIKQQKQINELSEALRLALDYIDAIPGDVELPAMPGFDWDWVDSVVAGSQGAEEEA